MAIFKLGAMFDAISGKIGGQSFANYPQYQSLKNITQTNKAGTPKQQIQRAFTAYLANSWRQLTTAQQQGWSATAVNYTYENRVGDTITRNGYQTFCFCNQNLNVISQTLLTTAPIYVPVTVPKINIIDISSGNFEIGSNNSTTAYLYALFAQANISAGANAQYGKMKFIGYITSAQLAAGYDVFSLIEGVFGTLNLPNKMAVIVDPINQTTGNRKQFVDIIQNIDVPMIIQVTVATGNTVTIPFASGGTYSGTIAWGDGTTTTFNAWNAAGTAHTYTLGGVYLILISGSFPKWYSVLKPMSGYLSNILQWGSNIFTVLNFYDSDLLTAVTPVDTPNLSNALLSGLFDRCSNLTTVAKLNEWDTSSVTKMDTAFRECSKFNQNINSWDVSQVTSFVTMFASCTLLVQDFNSWNVANCTDFGGMFSTIPNFNGDVTAWQFKTSGSISFNGMFFNCPKFNKNLSAWNVERVTNFTNVFYLASIFNQSLATWDIRNATQMLNALRATAMNATNWNATLIAWDALVNPPLNIVITCKAIATGAGLTAKNNLIATWGWTITEGI